MVVGRNAVLLRTALLLDVLRTAPLLLCVLRTASERLLHEIKRQMRNQHQYVKMAIDRRIRVKCHMTKTTDLKIMMQSPTVLTHNYRAPLFLSPIATPP